MQEFPNELKYTEGHLWVRVENDHTVSIGLTEYAQAALGEVDAVDLEIEVDIEVDASDEIGVIEAEKTTVDLLSPIAGVIIDINDAVMDAPGLINSDPYGDGWLYKLELQDLNEVYDLLSVDEYRDLVNGESDSDPDEFDHD